MKEAMTPTQIEILDHTLYRAAGGRYCGDSPDMQALVAAGYMESVGKVSWCPDEYFVITEAGVNAFGSPPAPSERGI